MIQKNKVICLIFNRLHRFSPGLHTVDPGTEGLQQAFRNLQVQLIIIHHQKPHMRILTQLIVLLRFPVCPGILQKTGKLQAE